MMDKDPTKWEEGIWLLAIGMSLAGGLAKCYVKFIGRKITVRVCIEFVAELCICVMVGLAVFMGVMSFDYPPGVSVSLACMGAHMSTGLIQPIENAIRNHLKKRGN
ncbi:phage holin family protein [Candidatus Nitrotoga sp. M5]|uniref:phage holin family protein n=1 Tax=Candidatus Nitrotoga sp. M5 TaxID=2890409 RepID=UPI001EF5D603|nr:phage holin family protein [Candidatus Nitrotoga sp. M5]CAH1387008.1 conserved hypothetical protein [Candidatus Nitrotoga sp. M5]